MERLYHAWKRTPHHIRKTVVFIVGMSFIVAAPFTAILPGPGGIPLFLIGIAILASEFFWAERLRNYFLMRVQWLRQLYRNHRKIGNIIIALVFVVGVAFMYILYQHVL